MAKTKINITLDEGIDAYLEKQVSVNKILNKHVLTSTVDRSTNKSALINDMLLDMVQLVHYRDQIIDGLEDDPMLMTFNRKLNDCVKKYKSGMKDL